MEIQSLQLIFTIIILIMSVVIHEVSHGYAAYMQGDPTAKYADRLTLNPIKHLEFMGSFLVPFFTYYLSGGLFTFGWAKPVPYNPYNLRNQRWGEALVALAGPVSNILIALIFGLIVRFGFNSLPISFIDISILVVLVNLGLAIFNLVPIPPLDGSKILFSVLPYRFQQFKQMVEQYSFLFVIIFIVFFSQYLGVVIGYVFTHLTGLTG